MRVFPTLEALLYLRGPGQIHANLINIFIKRIKWPSSQIMTVQSDHLIDTTAPLVSVNRSL